MNKYKEIEGNLITLAQEGEFDVIAHGCNCFCAMGAGIAPQMAKAFGCDKFPLELESYTEYTEDGLDYQVETHNKGDINKLGQIDYQTKYIWFKHPSGSPKVMGHMTVGQKDVKELVVINAYTQYDHSARNKPFDYEAFQLCMRKINHTFKGKKIGLPQIGAGLAGGSWSAIKNYIKGELADLDVTVVIYKS